jgi:peptidoglycan/LPS O-acetylase OafA/YrhL
MAIWREHAARFRRFYPAASLVLGIVLLMVYLLWSATSMEVRAGG